MVLSRLLVLSRLSKHSSKLQVIRYFTTRSID